MEMTPHVQSVAAPLREIEVVGCDDAEVGQRYADAIQVFGVLLMHTHPFITLEHVQSSAR